MYSLREIIGGIKEPYNHICSINFPNKLNQYIVSLVLNNPPRKNIQNYNPKIKLLEFPFYKKD